MFEPSWDANASGAAVNFTGNWNTVANVTFLSTSSAIARTEGVVTLMRKLTDARVYVVQYHGDADVGCNWYGGEAIMNEIDAPGIASTGYQNFARPGDAKVYGQVKQSANFAFVRVYEAGHEVPYWQSVYALEVLNRILNGLDLATGAIEVSEGSGYRTTGPLTSDFREGNATVHQQVSERFCEDIKENTQQL